MSSLSRGYANLLSIVPILVYVTLKLACNCDDKKVMIYNAKGLSYSLWGSILLIERPKERLEPSLSHLIFQKMP